MKWIQLIYTYIAKVLCGYTGYDQVWISTYIHVEATTYSCVSEMFSFRQLWLQP